MAVRTLDAGRTSQKASTLAKAFGLRIVGQPQAVDKLVALVDKFHSGMYDKTRPIGSLLELGPTGTGKTAVAEAFVEGLGGTARNLMKIDCGEFQHSHEIAKLVGSPPGYLGHRETHPFFTNAALKAARCDQEGKELLPFTVILWDEIEKASDGLWALMLGILDKARLTTGTNELIDFSQTVHILTSNVGAAEMSDETALGFTAGVHETGDAKMQDIVMNAARRKFPPEFINRMDDVICFKTLTQEDLKQILAMQLDLIQDRIWLTSNVIFEMNVSPAALTQILKEGYDRRYNARNLKRTIDKYVFLPLARLVSTGQVMTNDVVVVGYKDEKWEYFAVSPLGKGTSLGKE